MLAESGVSAPVKVLNALDGQPIPCVEVWRYHGEGAEYVAVMRNPEFDADSLAGYPDNSALEASVPVRVVFRKRAQVKDVRTGEDLGVVNEVERELDPWSPIFLQLSDADGKAGE